MFLACKHSWNEPSIGKIIEYKDEAERVALEHQLGCSVEPLHIQSGHCALGAAVGTLLAITQVQLVYDDEDPPEIYGMSRSSMSFQAAHTNPNGKRVVRLCVSVRSFLLDTAHLPTTAFPHLHGPISDRVKSLRGSKSANVTDIGVIIAKTDSELLRMCQKAESQGWMMLSRTIAGSKAELDSGHGKRRMMLAVRRDAGELPITEIQVNRTRLPDTVSSKRRGAYNTSGAAGEGYYEGYRGQDIGWYSAVSLSRDRTVTNLYEDASSKKDQELYINFTKNAANGADIVDVQILARPGRRQHVLAC